MIVIKICGIICEYNPFHSGHKYQISQARKNYDAVICIMSGSFVQRGENAVFDKFTRAKAAVENGADAVFELPQIFALQSAEHFAAGGVLSAAKIGCNHLLFGSECGDLSLMASTVESNDFQCKISSGTSYANSLNIFSGQPNSMLGYEYLRAIKEYNLPITPHTLKRSGSYLSASEIRRIIREQTFTEELLCSSSPLFPEDFFEMIKYRISVSSPDELRNICGVNEGLEYKLKKEICNAADIDGFIKSVKSKRYTYSRISRILFCTLLNIKKEDLCKLKKEPPALKLLAIKSDKISLLSQLKNFYISPKDAAKFGTSTELSNDVNLLASEVYSIKHPHLTSKEDYSPSFIKV